MYSKNKCIHLFLVQLNVTLQICGVIVYIPGGKHREKMFFSVAPQ